MNMDIMKREETTFTMSSREIAHLCEKQHKHILRDIENMIQDIGGSRFGPRDFEATYIDSRGKSQREIRLPKNLTVTLITGYRADLRFRVVNRLEELESQSRPAILSAPQRMAAALIDAHAMMNSQSAQIDEMREDVDAHERLTKADGSLNITEAAKNLSMRPKDLFQWLKTNGWIYKRMGSGSWLGYQTKCTQGLMEHKTTAVTRADGSDKISEQVRVTAKGLSKLAKVARLNA
jgi:phage antirepressor YoqD-like protein